MEFSWKTKGIVLTSPLSEEIDDVIKFIDEYLAPRGFNMIVIQVRYRYQFSSHPEVWGYDPLSAENVKKLLEVCRKNNIKLVPKMNLIGHQSGFHNEPTDGILHGHNAVLSDICDGLLRAYPHFDEQCGIKEILYSRSICLSSREAKAVVCELIDELMDVFEANMIHIGCDEAFNIGMCPKCSKISKGELFADWVNNINDYVKNRGGTVLVWGDRLLSAKETGYNRWEASDDGSDSAIDMLSKDIVICDWHYDKYEKYPSIDIFANKGYKIMVSPWRDKENLEAFLSYAGEHDMGHINGVLMTTWCASGDLAKRLLYGEKGRWLHIEQIASTINEIFPLLK
ncbi:MAG: family 20 glycosylhydrolase [Clostridia bacterium]|nr:family 20 glycosylhydrolase [Clostridia bacterium]